MLVGAGTVPGRRCGTWVVPLQVAARCLWQSGALGTGRCQKGRVFGCPEICFAIWGLCWRNFFGHWFSHSACGSQRGKSTAAAPSAQATASHAPATSTSKKYEEIVET